MSLGKAIGAGGAGVSDAGEIASKPLEFLGVGNYDGGIVGRVANAGFDESLEINSVYLINGIS
eukprot:5824291-Pyramimonas_sp.AAC.1